MGQTGTLIRDLDSPYLQSSDALMEFMRDLSNRLEGLSGSDEFHSDLMVALQFLYLHFRQSEIDSELDPTKAIAEAIPKNYVELRSLMVE